MNSPTQIQGRLSAALMALATILTACSAATTQSSDPTSIPSSSEQPASASPSAVPAPQEEPAVIDEGPPVGIVVADEPLVLRSAPGTGADSVVLEARLHQSMIVRLLEGPVAQSGYDWYRVATGAVEGWAAAGTRDGEPYEPWLARLTNGLIAVADDGQLTGAAPQVFLVDDDGTDRGQLTHFTGDDLAFMTGHHGDIVPALTCGTGIDPMAWSPTGNELALAIGSCGKVIHVVDAEGSSGSRVAEGTSLAWSPDGSSLALSANLPYLVMGCADDGPWELRVVALDADAERTITHSEPCMVASQPSWAPDGQTIAFTLNHADDFGGDGASVWLVDLETGAQRHLTEGWQPQWSPDGSRLLVGRVEDTNGDDPGCGFCARSLFSVAVDGSGEIPFESAYAGAWAPDGEHVSLMRSDPGREPEVVVTSTDGSAVLASIEGVFRGWSPDGREILISRGTQLLRHPLSGAEPVLLTDRLAGAVAWQPIVSPLTQ